MVLTGVPTRAEYSFLCFTLYLELQCTVIGLIYLGSGLLNKLVSTCRNLNDRCWVTPYYELLAIGLTNRHDPIKSQSWCRSIPKTLAWYIENFY